MAQRGARASARGRVHAGRTPLSDPFTPAEPIRARADRLPLGLLILLLLALLVVFRQRAANSPGVRTDSWTEANIYVSARNVAANGWAKYGGAAPHQVDRQPFVEDPFFRYAHYPLGTYYINWLLFDLGARSLPAWRWLPMLLSLASLALWYALLCRFVGRWVALLSTVLLGTSYGFLDFADNVHQGYSNVLVVGMALAFVAGAASVGRRRAALMATSWVLLFLNAFVSWEWYLWSQVFYWGYALLVGVPFQKRWLFAFALAPVLAFAIQSHQRAVALGTQTGAGFAQDLLRRTIRLEETSDTPLDVTLANYPLHVANRFRTYYGMGLGAVAMLALAWGVLVGGVRRPFRTVHPVFRLVGVLFLCSVSWWCVMLQHTAAHPHVMRHAQLFHSLVLGLAVALGLVWAFDKGRPLWIRAASGLVVVLVLGAHGARSYQNLRLHLDPRYGNPWDSGWSEGKLLADLARELPGDAIVLTNKNRAPLLRYWTNQPVYLATLLPYPYHREHAVPGARPLIELTTSHLKELYGDHLPRILYVYFFRGQPEAAYSNDAILRHMVDGRWDEQETAPDLENFTQVLTRGQGHSACPIIARGRSWLAFDARALVDNVPALPPPTRAEYGPPR